MVKRASGRGEGKPREASTRDSGTDVCYYVQRSVSSVGAPADV